jgi:hypothetical protein
MIKYFCEKCKKETPKLKCFDRDQIVVTLKHKTLHINLSIRAYGDEYEYKNNEICKNCLIEIFTERL